MALMTCPDCANQYPDDAPYCPNCGRPNPARQAGAAGGATGAAQPETPAGTGPTSGGYTAGTGSTAGGGYTQGPSSGGYSAGAGSPSGAGGGYGEPGGGGAGGYGGGGGGYGGAPAGGSPPQQIPNYLVQAILVTLCCCLPFGIVSIVYATQVNTKRDVGDIAGAIEASNNAKKWAMIGAGVGVVWILIIAAFYGLAILAAVTGGANS
ncbi:MAG TPA: CD225/dispanin family protein [Longimicrobium sp.]|jgi:hypothetical protein|nr:CD225/dispanin family protein [Longimicrobium sp.]